MCWKREWGSRRLRGGSAHINQGMKVWPCECLFSKQISSIRQHIHTTGAKRKDRPLFCSPAKLIVLEMRRQINKANADPRWAGGPTNRAKYIYILQFLSETLINMAFTAAMYYSELEWGMNMAISFVLRPRWGVIKCVLVATKRASQWKGTQIAQHVCRTHIQEARIPASPLSSSSIGRGKRRGQGAHVKSLFIEHLRH